MSSNLKKKTSIFVSDPNSNSIGSKISSNNKSRLNRSSSNIDFEEEIDEKDDDDSEDNENEISAKVTSAKDLEWTQEEQQNGILRL